MLTFPSFAGNHNFEPKIRLQLQQLVFKYRLNNIESQTEAGLWLASSFCVHGSSMLKAHQDVYMF